MVYLAIDTIYNYLKEWWATCTNKYIRSFDAQNVISAYTSRMLMFSQVIPYILVCGIGLTEGVAVSYLLVPVSKHITRKTLTFDMQSDKMIICFCLD